MIGQGVHMAGWRQSTVLGLVGGFVLLLGMMVMSPDHIGAFLNIPGLLVVIGGTLAATCISRPLAEVRDVLRALPGLLQDTRESRALEVQQLLRCADWLRHRNLHAAERQLAQITDPFLHAGLRMVIDGCQVDDLAKALQWRMAGQRAREQGQAHILRTMAVFAPAFGMLGTLFGLVHMLSGLGSSGLEQIGGSMAFAMITTVYGIVAANLFFKPLAIKMERRTQQRQLNLSMLMEGMLLTQQRRHPTLIRETLEAFELQQTEPAVAAPLTLVKA